MKLIRSYYGQDDELKNLFASQYGVPPVTVYVKEELGAMGILIDHSDKHVVSVANLREDIDALIGKGLINFVFHGRTSDSTINALIELTKEHPSYRFIVSGADRSLPKNKVIIEDIDYPSYGGGYTENP